MNRHRQLSFLCVMALVLTGLTLAPWHPPLGASAASYSSTVLSDGPVSYWRLGELTGTTVADSGTGGNNGTINGGTRLGTPGALTGDSNTALSFDGFDGYVGVPSKANLNIAGNLTVEVWAKPGALNYTTQAVLHKGDSSPSAGPGWQYRISINSSNRWKALIYVGSTTYSVIDTRDTLTTGRWDHLVLVRNANSLLFYVNGTSVGSTAVSGPTNTTSGMLALGRTGSDPDYYLNGSVDEVAIYNKALSASQIQNHYSVSKIPPATPTSTAIPPTATATAIPSTATATAILPTATATAIPPTATATAIPSTATATAIPPTATNTSVPSQATATSVPPTDTPTTASNSPTPTNTAVPATPTSTPVPPTSTSTSLPASYASTLLNDGPTSYWRLGEPNGATTLDSAGGGNSGSITGGVVLGLPGAIAGDNNTAMSFDGSTGYVSVADSANLDQTGDMSVELWAEPGAFPGTPQTLVQKGDSSTSAGPGWQYRLSINSAGQWKGQIYSGTTTYQIVDTSDVLSTGRWDHLVLVRSGSTLTFYVNGASVGSVTVNGPTNTSTGILAFGRAGSYDNYYFNGVLDEVAFYSKALTVAQIQNHYTLGRTGVSGPTATPTATSVPIPTPTNGPTSTNTPVPTPTATPVATSTGTPSPTFTGDPVIMAAGDIACDPSDSAFNGGNGTTGACQQKATSNQLLGLAGILTLGDNQYEDATLSAFQQAYGSSWGSTQQKLDLTHPATGNHEYRTAGANGYFSYFGSAASPLDNNCSVSCRGYYSYDIGTWHFISINSECGEVGGCNAGSPMEQWLKADLIAHPNYCTLAYWHRPLFDSGFSLGDTSFYDLWVDLYNAHASVVLNGHSHDYERFAPQDPNGTADAHGIREFVVGTGGKLLTGFSATAQNSEVRNADTYGVLKLTLHATSYDWRFLPDGVPGSGTFSDSGSASCR